jgi:quinol monooxygenase YgiN
LYDCRLFEVFDSGPGGKIAEFYQRMGLVFAERRVLVVIIRITMNALMEKRTELMQTLLSLIDPTENERGCQSCQIFRGIEDQNVFSLIEQWASRENLNDHFKSDRFSVLLGTKSLLFEPPQIEIHTISHSEGREAIDAIRSKRIL